ncbi:MAG TPA: Os1348 family NHLP clan protein [Candidatus Limnocylindria bacterium]|nr:Os1348 family NHLP clan protein [Candidatus Limnocylindria bacterium]
MSQEVLEAVLERAMSDATFRAELAADPAKALAGYDLTDLERATFRTGSLRVERLEDRMSKSDLSAAMSVKTSSPVLKSPSQGKRR